MFDNVGSSGRVFIGSVEFCSVVGGVCSGSVGVWIDSGAEEQATMNMHDRLRRATLSHSLRLIIPTLICKLLPTV